MHNYLILEYRLAVLNYRVWHCSVWSHLGFIKYTLTFTHTFLSFSSVLTDNHNLVFQVFPQVLHEVQSELSQKRGKPSRHAQISGQCNRRHVYFMHALPLFIANIKNDPIE